MPNVPTEALAPRVVTSDELTLIKATVAVGATDAELKLFLFDCARQGVHPLDRLIHFTKRSGKYTPITSIDFMRIRAAESGEYAGNHDAYFAGTPMTPDFFARVSVYRMVQGQRCEFVATARWTEYKPEQNDFMWRKMPHTMLGKCAEALALRKGFPRQLAGLYAKEEMDQADTIGSTAMTVPIREPINSIPPPQAGELLQTPASPPRAREKPAAAEGGEPAALPPRDPGEDDDGLLRVVSVQTQPTKNPNVLKALINFSDGRVRSTINTMLINAAEQCREDGTPVLVEDRQTKWGWDLVKLTKAGAA